MSERDQETGRRRAALVAGSAGAFIAAGILFTMGHSAPITVGNPPDCTGDCSFTSLTTTSGDITSGDDLISTDDVEAGDDVKVTTGNLVCFNAACSTFCGDVAGQLVCQGVSSGVRFSGAMTAGGTSTLGNNVPNYITIAGGTTGLPPTITQSGEAGVGLTISAGTGQIMLGTNFSVDADGNIAAVGAGFTDVVTAYAGIDIGGSDIITESQSCSGALNFGSIAAGADAELTFTCTGAAVGDPVTPVWPTTLESGLVGMMWVSASGTMRVRLSNIQLLAAIDPAEQTFGSRTFNP